MKVLIIGPGAVGCILGASLIRSGQDVTFLARGASLEALRNQGLKIEWSTEAWQINQVNVIESGVENKVFDHILFCVKGYDWQNASALLDTFNCRFISTLQNGVIVHKELRKQFGDSVRAAVIYVSADRIAPGVVRSKSNSKVVLDGNPLVRDAMNDLRQGLSNSWLTAQLSENIEVDLWRKYLFLCSFSALNTLTERPIANLLNDPYTKDLWIRFMAEIAEIARASGIDFPEDEVQTAMSNAEKFPPGTTSSLFSDTQRKSQTEVELLQGHLARLAAEHRVSAPISSAVYALLRQKTAF